jgi:hypothetical protein
MIAAAAMAFDCTIKDLEKFIGHDGSEIIHPHLRGPAQRKGFHSQEIIGAALAMGYAMTPIEAVPVQTATGVDRHGIVFPDFNSSEERLSAYLYKSRGIVCGVAPSGLWHAIAWDGENCYDPQGRVYSMEDIKIRIRIYWIVSRIAN